MISMEFKEKSRDFENVFFLLYKLAEMGGNLKIVHTSTQFLGKELGLSQQTISRRLIELERKGWIQRMPGRDGTYVRISTNGEALLKKVNIGLNLIFEKKRSTSFTIEGTVFNGIGEGAYYVSRPFYKKQFIKKLKFDPYPGTLNLRITGQNHTIMREELKLLKGIEIEGYRDKNRTYGNVKCYPVLINNQEKGAIIIALRTHYDDTVVEVISPIFLRDHFNLENGDKLRLTLLI